MPLARGAISRAILAHLPRRQMLSKIRENLDDLRELGMGDTVEEIADNLRQMRKGGTLIARGEVTDGVVGIAAPVFDASRAPVAVLCLTVDRDTLDDAKLKELSGEIWAAATRLSDALTHMRIEDVVLGEL
jgi:DNA-binding IclR family transcriptional regulator